MSATGEVVGSDYNRRFYESEMRRIAESQKTMMDEPMLPRRYTGPPLPNVDGLDKDCGNIAHGIIDDYGTPCCAKGRRPFLRVPKDRETEAWLAWEQKWRERKFARRCRCPACLVVDG